MGILIPGCGKGFQNLSVVDVRRDGLILRDVMHDRELPGPNLTRIGNPNLCVTFPPCGMEESVAEGRVRRCSGFMGSSHVEGRIRLGTVNRREVPAVGQAVHSPPRISG